jgi:hypothetical protein
VYDTLLSTTKEAEVPKLVEPPPVAGRGRASTIPESELREMAELVEEGWVTNEQEYGSKKKAMQEGQKYKRGILRVVDDLENIKMRTWATDGSTDPESGVWVFALHAVAEGAARRHS